jgi:hypothetical protein
MRFRIIFYLIVIAGIVENSGCVHENKELKKDAVAIAAVMCKNMEAMKKLRTADPADSMLVKKLQSDYQDVASEMAGLYEVFRKKYGDKTTTREFGQEFRKYLNEAMLDCKSLSKEDREAFEKGLK